MHRARRLVTPILAIVGGCVTYTPSSVDDAFITACAPPALSVAFTDPDGLPRTYDDALAAAVAPEGPRTGHAVRVAEGIIAEGLAPYLDAYRGSAACALAVEVENVILPDATRFTPLSGMKSFGVAFRLAGPDGAVLAETERPFTVLSEMQRSGRFGGSAWRRIGNTDDLRVGVVVTLSEATAQVVGEAVTGGRAQSGLSGRLVAYPERLPPAKR